MLRDALTRLPGVGTWPCDEINYIWRHGNVRYPSDEFTAEMARPAVQRYVRRAFDRVARRYQLETVVEKTCANSLRVDFVHRVVPDAHYVFIRRDGLDAISSAVKRWTGSADFSYLARKARFVPLSDIPYYGARHVWNRLYRKVSARGRLAFWGPRIDGMADLVRARPLEEVCALQWKRCVESAAGQLASLPKERVVEVSYEDLVGAPQEVFAELVAKLGIASGNVGDAVREISDTSVGKGRRELGEATIARLVPLVGETLDRYGYRSS